MLRETMAAVPQHNMIERGSPERTRALTKVNKLIRKLIGCARSIGISRPSKPPRFKLKRNKSFPPPPRLLDYFPFLLRKTNLIVSLHSIETSRLRGRAIQDQTDWELWINNSGETIVAFYAAATIGTSFSIRSYSRVISMTLWNSIWNSWSLFGVR